MPHPLIDSAAVSGFQQSQSSNGPPAPRSATPLTGQRAVSQQIAERMREVVGDQTFREIGDRTGGNPETIRRYFLSGKPSITFFAAFCESYNVRADWLLTGQGHRHRIDQQAQESHGATLQLARGSRSMVRDPVALRPDARRQRKLRAAT